MKKTMLFPACCVVALGFVALSAFSVHRPAMISTPQGGEKDFDAFLAAFPDASFPYVISEKDLQERLEKAVKDRNGERSTEAEPIAKQLEYRLRKFLPGVRKYDKFSRNPVDIEPVAKLSTGIHYAVIYSTNRGFVTAYKSYHIALFDLTGKHQGTHLLASLKPEEVVSAVLNKDLQVTAKTFNVNWENDFSKNGMDNNKVTGLTLTKTEEIDLTSAEKPQKETPKTMKKAPDSPATSGDKKAKAK
jgi:hypothetical protein